MLRVNGKGIISDIMKIGIFTESFLPQVNGVVTAVCTSAKALSESHDVKIFTVGNGVDKASGCDVIRFRGMNLPTYKGYKFFVPSKDMWKRLTDIRLDIVHVRSSVAFGLIALRFARKRGIPIIGTLDTPISDYVHYVPLLGKMQSARNVLSGTALKYMVWYYNKCNAVIVPSKVTADWLQGIGCDSKIIVLSNGVDTNRFNPNERSNSLRKELGIDKELVLLHVGRITKEKSVGILIKAANTLKEDGRQFKLVIAGKGPALSSLKREAKLLGIDDCVSFAGFVPDKELPKYYASADAFVTASPVETEGIVMLEAMASGLPVIGTDAGAIPEIVRDGANGFVFHPDDHNALAGDIIRLMDKKRLRHMSASALKTSRKYSIDKTIKGLEKMYSELVKAND